MRAIARYKLPIILLIAVVIRLGVLLAFPGIFNYEQTGAVHGSGAYDEYAVNLLATGVYGQVPNVPDASIPPGYSYALAAVYALAGRGGVTVGVFHTLLDVVTITCLYYIGVRLFGRASRTRGEWVGAGAALFTAGYPYLVFQNLTVIDTPLFMALLYGFLLSVIALRDREQTDAAAWGLAALAGLLLGASVLVRPILPPLAALVALWFLFRRGPLTTAVRLAPVAVLSVTVLLGWTWRNYGVYDDFVPMTTTSGANFWQGNSEYTVPYFRAGYDVQWTTPEQEMAGLNSREADAERFALALAYLQDHPERIPEMLWVKFGVHWSVDIAPRRNPTAGEGPRLGYDGDALVVLEGDDIELGGLPEGDPAAAYTEPLFDRVGRALHRYYYGGLFVLCLAGMLLTVRAWREVSLLWLTQFCMTFVYVLLHPSTRYRVPTDPLLFLFSAAAVWALVIWGLRTLRTTERGG